MKGLCDNKYTKEKKSATYYCSNFPYNLIESVLGIRLHMAHSSKAASKLGVRLSLPRDEEVSHILLDYTDI